jgi:class 3 adenylate cyclase/predicted ATPase
MDCPHCGASNPESKRHCGDCGAMLLIRCASCGCESPPGKKFCGDCGVALPRLPEPSAPKKGIPRSKEVTAQAAERRQITVMFCDLVGSTALSASMDPEDLREIISAYQACAAETVRQYGGFVAKYMGDGVLVYFGYPRADEHDAERAARAALALVAAVCALKSPAPLQTRVGIATGVVVIGDLVGSGEAQERGIVGETPNLAARLQAMAEPNTVVTSESTRRLLGDLFRYSDLGMVELRGFPQPIRAVRIMGESAIESRFEALHANALTGLVGRKNESDLLLRRWRQARDGAGQVVLIAGEPGIGKSRLAAAVLDRVAAEPHTRRRYFCSPHRSESAFFPFILHLERAAGFEAGDSPQTKLDKIEAKLAEASVSVEDGAIFAELLSLPSSGRDPSPELRPQERRTRKIEALTREIEVLAGKQPVLIIFEDVHWIDPTSRDVLSRMIERIRDLSVLLLVTFRPEFGAPWAGQSHVTELILSRLGPGESVDLIQQIVSNNALSSDVVNEIVARTDGVPLFVEELTKAVVEAGEMVTKTLAETPVSTLAVPATLHASLMARLDRLGPAKDVAQIAAAIGREFSYELLSAVSHHNESALAMALDRLMNADLLSCRGTPPHATYLFKHALVQDAAYGTLLRRPRRELHARIASALIENFPEIAETSPEIVAYHHTEAGLIEQAAGFWGKAGQRSIAQSAMAEAVAHLTKALALIATLPSTHALRCEQINLQVALAGTLLHVKGFGSSETRKAFDQAHTLIEHAESLGEHSEDPLLRFIVLYGQWTANFVTSNFDRMSQIARKFLSLAEKQTATAPLIMGHRIMGGTFYVAGRYRASRMHLDQAIAIYVPQEHRDLATQFGQDIGVAARCYRTIPLCHLGYPESALHDAEQALSYARELGQVGTLSYAVFFAALLELRCRMVVEAAAHVDELISLSDKHGLLYWKLLGSILRGWLLIETGRPEQASELLSLTIPELVSSGTVFAVPMSFMRLAQANARCGRLIEAHNCISEATIAKNAARQGWERAELYQIAGELELHSSNRDLQLAERQFQRSLSVARQQHAKWPELHTATSLARLWQEQGRGKEAYRLLAPIYDWFIEGLGLRDLKDAKALLVDLNSKYI